MVRHDLHRIMFHPENDKIFDEIALKRLKENPKDRSEEEIYYKYMAEEIIKSSGLWYVLSLVLYEFRLSINLIKTYPPSNSYAIARISELNELNSGEFSTLRLHQSGNELMPVSRAEVADVCVSALLDPNASNLCFYVSKAKAGIDPVDILQVEKVSKFKGLRRE